jgi:hypothetical protein
MPETAVASEVIDHLEALAADLNGRGFATKIMPHGRYPSVRVVNRTALHLSDQVFVARASDGSVWFWWSWAERIAPTGRPDMAAAKIAHVLDAGCGDD